MCTFSNTYFTNLVDIYGFFRPYHARPIMQPYGHHFRTECEAEDESSVQLFPQDSAQVAKELFEDCKPILRISTLHLDCGYNLQPPNRLWLEKNRLVDSIRRKQNMYRIIFLYPFFPFLLAFYLAFALFLLRFLILLVRSVSVGNQSRTGFSPETLLNPSVLQRLAEQREHGVSIEYFYYQRTLATSSGNLPTCSNQSPKRRDVLELLRIPLLLPQ